MIFKGNLNLTAFVTRQCLTLGRLDSRPETHLGRYVQSACATWHDPTDWR